MEDHLGNDGSEPQTVPQSPNADSTVIDRQSEPCLDEALTILSRFGVSVIRIFSLLFLVVCAACNTPPEAPQLERLRIGMRRAPDSLNPYVSTRLEGELIAFRLYPKLFIESPPKSEGLPVLQPFLLANHQWREDGLTLELELKKGLTWSDGEPLTSADLDYTFSIQKDGELGWVSSGRKENVQGWQILDDHRLEVQFKRQSAFNLLDLNEGVVVPRHFYGQWPTKEWIEMEWDRELVVYGPYQVDAWVPDERLVLKGLGKNPAPTLGLAFVRDRDALFRLVESGELDYAIGLPIHRIPDLKDLAKPIVFPDLTFAFIGWNPLLPGAFEQSPPDDLDTLRQLLQSKPHPIFGDSSVRRALTHAIRRESHLNNLWHGLGALPANPWQAGLPYRKSTIEPLSYDPQKAAELLEKAGWILVDGIRQRDGKPFQFKVICNTGSPIREAYLLAIQEDLRAIGIHMEIDMMEAGRYIQACSTRNFDAMFGSFRTGTRPDLSSLYGDEEAVNGYNFCSWIGQDSLLERVHLAKDLAELETSLRGLEEAFFRDQPLTMLYRGMNVGSSSRQDLAIKANPLDYFFEIERWAVNSAQ